MPTVHEALTAGQKKLKGHRCRGSDPSREAAAFLVKTTGWSREKLLAEPERRLPPAAWRRFFGLIRRRLAHEPFEQVVGAAHCRHLELNINSHILIPRSATENIIEKTLEICRRERPTAMVDVGTGSGCIALCLADEAPMGVNIHATDASAAALTLARRNAKKLGLAGKITFKKGDLLAPVVSRLRRTSGLIIIAANLPYLPTRTIARLPREIRLHEPRLALDGGRDGLEPYRRLLDQSAAELPDRDLIFVLEFLPAQFRPLARYAQKKIPGLKAEKIVNLSGTVVGAVLDCRRVNFRH